MADAIDTQCTEATPTDDTSPPNHAPTESRMSDEPDTPNAGDKTALLHELVATIRASVAPGVTPEARAAGAAACRAILTALEAQVGQSLVPATSSSTASPASPAPTSPLARILSQLTAMPREQFTGILSQLAAMPREQ